MLAYADALRAIFERADYERGDRPTAAYAERVWRLDRVRDLMAALGDPHRRFRSVHIAGTKGKGSTTAMVESILRAQGYRTGMYTSPHLHTFRERIQCAGALISEEEVSGLVSRLLPVIGARPEVTVFEIITALAMCYFAERQVDVAVVEVGMGGRLDATNVLTPEVVAITSISLDHTRVLGDTLAAIAGEKAGIIKPDVPVVSAPQAPEALDVIAARAQERGAPLTLVGRDWLWRPGESGAFGQRADLYRAGHEEAPEYPGLTISLLGAHQLENATTAVAAVDLLSQRGSPVGPEAVRCGLAEVCWPGRFEILHRRPLVVVDGAHNAYSVERLLEALRGYLSYRSLILVFGASATHAPEGMLERLLPAAQQTYLVQAHHAKATPLAELEQAARALGHTVVVAGEVPGGLERALAVAGEDDLVLVAGSLFVVAEARAAWAVRDGLGPLPFDPPGVY